MAKAAKLLVPVALQLGGCSGGASSVASIPPDGGTGEGSCGPNEVALVRCAAPERAPLTLAVCNDLRVNNSLIVDGRGGQADVAVGGSTTSGGAIRIEGDFTSVAGIVSGGALTVERTLRTGGDWVANAGAQIGGDVHVGGVLRASSRVDVTGTVTAKEITQPSNVRAASVSNAAPNLTAPLECEAAPNIAERIAEARTGPLRPAEALVGGETRAFTCGRYVLSSLAPSSETLVRIDGTAVLVVEGDVAINGSTRFELTPGSRLDVLVGGSLVVNNPLTLSGGPVWIGVAGDVRVNATLTMEGWIVAPRAVATLNNPIELTGAAMFGSLTVSNAATFRRGPSVTGAGCVGP